MLSAVQEQNFDQAQRATLSMSPRRLGGVGIGLRTFEKHNRKGDPASLAEQNTS